MKFTDVNRIPGMTRLLKPMLARNLENNIKETHDRMIRNWEKGEDTQGKPWEPLAPETVSRKGHSIPLIETRDMIQSAGYSVETDKLEGQIYIDDEKAIVHENGAPSQGIPPRPILGPTRDYFAENTDTMIGSAIDSSFARAGAAGIALNFAGRIGGGR